MTCWFSGKKGKEKKETKNLLKNSFPPSSLKKIQHNKTTEKSKFCFKCVHGPGAGILVIAWRTSHRVGLGVISARWGSRELSQPRVWGEIEDLGEGNREGGAWESGKRAGGVSNLTARDSTH